MKGFSEVLYISIWTGNGDKEVYYMLNFCQVPIKPEVVHSALEVVKLLLTEFVVFKAEGF